MKTTKLKKRAKDPRGRKPLSSKGLERRQCKVLASFTPREHAALVARAHAKGVSLAELVAAGALAFVKVDRA